MTNRPEDANGAAELIYVMDPHCGWCFGFSGTMDEIVAYCRQTARLNVSLVTGGLFHPALGTSSAFAESKRPIAERVAALFGVRFAEGYFRDVLASGHLDSLVPCQFINAVKILEPDAAFGFAHRLIRAAFTEGRDISQAWVCQQVAGERGLDPAAVAAGAGSPEAVRLTQESFDLARRLGTGFPSLFLRRGDSLTHLGGADLTLESLKSSLEDYLEDPS